MGKSTLLRSLPGLEYKTLDDSGLLDLAERNPELLIEEPSIIDEAQKAPGIFDAIKLQVDRRKKPGSYVLTGSVRFSKRTLIREALTGRAKTLQLHPLTAAEAGALPFQNRWDRPDDARITRKQLELHLLKGGMPAIFAVRDPAEIRAYWRSLIDSYVHRDLLFALPKNPKPKIAADILKAVAETLALGEQPTFARLLKKVFGTRAQVARHLIALEDLMILRRIGHWEASPTKDIFMPFDSALFLALLDVDSPTHDLAVHQACIQISLQTEFLSQSQNSDRDPSLYYAESPQGHKVHLITRGPKKDWRFWKVFEEPVPHEYETRFITALAGKHKGKAIALTSTKRAIAGSIQIYPWEAIF